MVVVGKNEVIQEKVAVRKHGIGNIGSLTIKELATLLSRET
jgi:threonyl-tRNA synthetase